MYVCVRVAYLLSFEVHEIHRSANTVLTFYLGWSDQKHV
jgi:tryptophan-rich sensory protein